MALEVDEGDWPLVRLRYRGALTAADVTCFQSALTGYLDRGECFAVVVAESPRGRADRGTAKRQMAWLEDERDRLAELHAGMAVVADDDELAAARRSAKARDLSPYPMRLFARLGEAESWAWRRLASRRR
ncbi:hypothetical protein [Amycolatopsis sp. NPDC059021]|uniref:hypothetical protein n=1 Tax=Amycolatopsis sp. NPDC059021 TaxID=3346704 RepID=UPI00366C44A3